MKPWDCLGFQCPEHSLCFQQMQVEQQINHNVTPIHCFCLSFFILFNTSTVHLLSTHSGLYFQPLTQQTHKEMAKEVCLRPVSLSFSLARMSSTTLCVPAVTQWHLSQVCSLVWFSALIQSLSQLKTLNSHIRHGLLISPIKMVFLMWVAGRIKLNATNSHFHHIGYAKFH